MTNLIACHDADGETFLLEPSEGRTHLAYNMAVTNFAAVWTNDLSTVGDLAPNLSCAETEALADLLAALGFHDHADTLRKHHIAADDAGDLDHNTLEPKGEEHDPTPCCPDPGCNGSPCTFPGYAANH